MGRKKRTKKEAASRNPVQRNSAVLTPDDVRPAAKHFIPCLLASGLVPLAVYIYHLCPTIAAGDSGELVNCAAILGIPHPPGYPLFTMLGHVFTWIPFQSIAWRVNLLSAVCCAAACLFVFLTIHRLTGKNAAALAGAFGLGFSRYFWHYAEVAEVFPLNNLFTALLTYLIVHLCEPPIAQEIGGDNSENGRALTEAQQRGFLLFCFVFGLSLTNHHTIVLLTPAFVFYFLMRMPGLLRRPKLLLIAAGLFGAGLLPYIYSPLAASQNPPVNWDNPVNLENFIQLVTRADFGSFSLLARESNLREATSRMDQLPVFFGSFYHQFRLPGVLLALTGIIGCMRRKHIQGYLFLAFSLGGIFFVMFANMPIQNQLLLGVLHRFYLMPAVVFALWIGLGAGAIQDWIARRSLPSPIRKWGPASIAIVTGAWLYIANVEEADFRTNTLAEDFAANLMNALPGNALLFVRGDVASMGMDYLQMVQGLRPDIVTLDQEKLTYPWYYRQVQKRFPGIALKGERYDGVHTLNLHLIGDNIARRPVFFNDFKEYSHDGSYRSIPAGLAYRMIPKDVEYPLEQIETEMNRIFDGFVLSGLERNYPPTSFEYLIQHSYAEPYFRLGFAFEQAGGFDKAETYYRKALSMAPDFAPVLKNLGVMYLYKLNRPSDAVDMFRRYLDVRPDDPEADQIRRIIMGQGYRPFTFKRQSSLAASTSLMRGLLDRLELVAHSRKIGMPSVLFNP